MIWMPAAFTPPADGLYLVSASASYLGATLDSVITVGRRQDGEWLLSVPYPTTVTHWIAIPKVPK